MKKNLLQIFNFSVLVCTLGYLIDSYDLVLLSATRVQSLTALGITKSNQINAGVLLVNAQMIGLVLGGIAFGVLGDKFGRVRILFASIALYSLATFATAFITSFPAYLFLRFSAGLGLAAELGLAITLISEISSKEQRGYAAAVIAAFGMLGAVLAGASALYLNWHTCYIIGGVMGLVLLFLRKRLSESVLFQTLEKDTARGSLKLLFSNFNRVKRFLLCIVTAAPIPLTFWMLIVFAPEFTKLLGLSQPLPPGQAIIFGYLGLTLGDLVACILSQFLKSRRLAFLLFLICNFSLCIYYLAAPHADNPDLFRFFYALLGFTSGYWALMALIAAETFGINLRATVATTVPNIARAAAIPIGIILSFLKEPLGLIHAALLISAGIFTIAILSLLKIKETYGRDLDFIER